jgi:hypothetical protein
VTSTATKMEITKALIIADPWIGYILDGAKNWEMRSSSTSHRGWFGLIQKGSGAVHGIARLVDVGSPLSPAEMIGSFERHRISADMILSGEVAKWNTPWKLANVQRLAVPVPYRHKSGAVTWVALDQMTSKAIACQIDELSPLESAGPTKVEAPAHQKSQPASEPASGGGQWIGEIEINEANLRNNHFYLRPLVHKFPDDVIGGSNKTTAAKRDVSIDWGGPTDARTDIDGGDKKFFRARGWVGAFYKLHQAEPGDKVVIEQTAPYRYSVRLKKRATDAG